VSCIERGKNAPTIDRLQIISEALDVPIKDFFDYTNKTDDDAGIGCIDEMLKGLDEDKRTLANKIIRDIIKTLQET
jgi:transcriptional regulator with XRE-family HTH domain